MTLKELNNLEYDVAVSVLHRCCGSARWVHEVVAQRPFRSFEHLCRIADDVWWKLSEQDWREAFHHHPKIGALDSVRKKFAETATLAAEEQSGVQSASEETLRALAENNRAYESRFGYIFIVCAKEKSADEMVKLMMERLSNPPEMEIRIAAAEQARITRLRLEKLLDERSHGHEFLTKRS